MDQFRLICQSKWYHSDLPQSVFQQRSKGWLSKRRSRRYVTLPLPLTSCFLYGCLTSSSCLVAQLSHPALLRCWGSWEWNVSHAAAAVSVSVAALLSTALTHTVQIYWSISSHSSLCSPPLSALCLGWTISWLTDIRLALLLARSQEFVLSPPWFSKGLLIVREDGGKERERERQMLPVLRG